MLMDNKNQERDENREMRRSRRRKSQIMVYLCVTGVFIFLLFSLLALTYIFSFRGSREEIKDVEGATTEFHELEPETESSAETVESSTSDITEYSEEELLDEIVLTCISDMPLEDRVAGLFLVTPEALTGVDVAIRALDSTKEALEKYPVGGLIYFKQNIQNETQITEMLANTTAMSKYPIFLAVDEEGGTVARVADGLGLEKTPDAIELGKAGDATVVKEAYENIGTYLCQYGFNVNFAPVSDVLTNPDNAVIEKRAFGTDPETVGTMVSTAVQALESKGVTACLKHFPGQGDANLDTHDALAVSNRSLEELREVELKPFIDGINAGAEMIMVGHFVIPELTGEAVPASLSEEVMTDLLRDELGYEGVIITDALNMGAITEKYDSEEACVTALQSGADLLLMPEDFKLAYEAVLQAVSDGTLSEARINDSLMKIYRIKYKNAIDN